MSRRPALLGWAPATTPAPPPAEIRAGIADMDASCSARGTVICWPHFLQRPCFRPTVGQPKLRPQLCRRTRCPFQRSPGSTQRKVVPGGTAAVAPLLCVANPGRRSVTRSRSAYRFGRADSPACEARFKALRNRTLVVRILSGI